MYDTKTTDEDSAIVIHDNNSHKVVFLKGLDILSNSLFSTKNKEYILKIILASILCFALTLSAANTEAPNVNVDIQSSVDNIANLDLSYWGLRFTSIANQSSKFTDLKFHQMSSNSYAVFCTYRRGDGVSTADKEIKVAYSNDEGETWIEQDISLDNTSTVEHPIVACNPLGALVMYEYEDLDGGDRILITKFNNEGLLVEQFSINRPSWFSLDGLQSFIFSESGDIYTAHYYHIFASFDGGATFQEIEPPTDASNNLRIELQNNLLWATHLNDNHLIVSLLATPQSDWVTIVDNIIGGDSFDLLSLNDNTLAIAWTDEELGVTSVKFQTIQDGTASTATEVTNNSEGYQYQFLFRILLHKSDNHLWISTDFGKYLHQSTDLTGDEWSNASYLNTELNDFWFETYNNISIVNDSTIFMVGNGLTEDSDMYFHNLRWADFPYSTAFQDTILNESNFNLEWESYVYTSQYKFQLSNDNFKSLLLDILIERPIQGNPTISIPFEGVFPADGTFYSYRLCGFDDENYQTSWTPEIMFIYGAVGVKNTLSPPLDYKLNQNFPNPFNPSTSISYDLPEQSTATLTLYDIQGKVVTILQNGIRSPGNYEVQWNGLDQAGNLVSAGVYCCRLQAGSYSKTIKMLYLK